MSAALLRATALAMNAAAEMLENAGLAAEAKAIDAEMLAMPRVVEPVKPPSRHFLEGVDELGRKPLCHARDRHGAGWARGYYTDDPSEVTCKRCLRSLAKGGAK